MAPESEKSCENANSPPTSVERTKITRHPRWSRQETMVLIEAKKVVENGRTGICRYTSTSIPATATASLLSEPKWDMVSSLCKKQGVNRGAVQCRKRWSNLVSDFKKIKNWEPSKKEEDKSFWVMRKDERKENKLPGFFDEELYNVLEGGLCTIAPYPLTTSIDMRSRAENAAGEDEETEAEAEDEATEEEITEENTTRKKVTTPLSVLSAVRGKIMKGSVKEMPKHPLSTSGSSRGRDPVSEGAFKRMRLSPDKCEDTTHFNNQIIKVLKKNSNLLKAHLGAQNINHQLAREQQKEQTDSLVAALGKLTDALTKIADKL